MSQFALSPLFSNRKTLWGQNSRNLKTSMNVVKTLESIYIKTKWSKQKQLNLGFYYFLFLLRHMQKKCTNLSV